ncbi:MAG TPA: SpoIIE family protein phosphatase [Oligoflexus sp.]|uniref:SpoIIE family protein phosphatase n=1 Tax=Oligoflexus sp. TaxID=1971216 RepID=UPI002D805497|nr:SpoIIE family protein phosphatase [Oligoflexus sp.]HET9238995.1 SpoIIE family protein phosphatase [Oligoflexus sp.]
MNLLRIITLWLLCCSFAAAGSARVDHDPSPLTLREEPRGESLTHFLGILRDIPADWDAARVHDQFLKKTYDIEKGESVNFGLDFSIKWVTFQLTNPFSSDRLVLIENNTTITDRLELFQKTSEGFRLVEAQGEAIPFSTRSIMSRQPAFRVEVPPGTHTYLMRLEAQNVIQLGLKVWDEQAFYRKNTLELMTISLLLGFHLVIALYNFFLFVSVRDRMYLIYVAYVLSNVMYQTTAMGIMQYVNHAFFGWETLDNRVMILSVDAVILTALIFSNLFLSLKNNLPQMTRAMILCGFVSCVNIIINLFISSQTAAVLCLFNSVTAVTLLISSGVYLCWKRYKPAYFFTLAWFFYLTGASANIFSLIGLLPAFEVSNWVQLYGGSFEIVLLSLAVGSRMSHVQTRLTRVLTEQKQIEKVVRSAQFMRRREMESSLPEFLNYAYYTRPAEHIGGDWVGMVNCASEKKIYIYLGDVMGHGLSPALMSVIASGATRGAIHNSLRQAMDEKERMLHIVRSINDALFDRCHEADCFMSLALISLNWETGALTYANAGHTPLLKISGQRVQSFVQPGSLIGMFREPSFRVESIAMQPGESIFLYTDGLTENTSPGGKPLRLRAIHKALQTQGSLEDGYDSLIRLMNSHWNDQPVEDDTTFFMLCLADIPSRRAG